MYFIPVMESWNFNSILIHSSMSHDPSEIILTHWFGQVHFLLLLLFFKFDIINIFVEIYPFFQDSW